MKPQLQYKQAFKDILTNYEISDAGKQLLSQTELVLLASVTSAGRNTIINELIKTGEYEFIVSHTTRPPRENNGIMEKDGVEYFFRGEEDFLDDLQAGKFLEAELIHDQQVSGISMRELEKAVQHEKIAIDEVDNDGVLNVVKVKPDTHAIMVLPPNPDEWMRRLKARGNMTTDELINRLKSAEKILEDAQTRTFYKFVINDELEQAVNDVRNIVEHDTYSKEQHSAALEAAWNLLGWVKSQLNT